VQGPLGNSFLYHWIINIISLYQEESVWLLFLHL
jgi:hypothetical protein